MKVLTFSRQFPKKHPKAGEPTFFVEKILANFWDKVSWSDEKTRIIVSNYTDTLPLHNVGHYGEKLHTIRNGHRWKIGDMASLRVWYGKPYASKQVEFAQVQIKKIWNIKIDRKGNVIIKSGKKTSFMKFGFPAFARLSHFDGFEHSKDLIDWFKCHPMKKKGKYIFVGQIICWSDKITY